MENQQIRRDCKQQHTGGYPAAILIHPPTDLAVIVMVNSQLGGVVGGRAGLFDQIAAALVNVVLDAGS